MLIAVPFFDQMIPEIESDATIFERKVKVPLGIVPDQVGFEVKLEQDTTSIS